MWSRMETVSSHEDTSTGQWAFAVLCCSVADWIVVAKKGNLKLRKLLLSKAFLIEDHDPHWFLDSQGRLMIK